MRTFSACAIVAAAASSALAQPTTVEFRVVERHAVPIATVTGTDNNVLNYAVQARVRGAVDTGLAQCSFSVQLAGESESAGTLALNTINDTNGTYWTGAIGSTSAAAGLRAGMANAYRYLVGVNPAFNGLINTTGGSWTNNPTQQDIGLITLSTDGSNYLAYTDPSGHGFPDNPLNAATELNPYFGANGNWVDVYRFQYTVTNLSTNRTIPVNVVVEGTVNVFSSSAMAGGLWGPAATAAAGTSVSGSVFTVSVIGACCDTMTASCSLNSAAGCTGGLFQGVGTSCASTACPGGACCQNATGSCTFTGTLGCAGARTFFGTGTACTPTICPAGTCCAADGTCQALIQSACSQSWVQGGACSPNTCPQPGTCCSSVGACFASLQAACAAGGTWSQGGTCSPNTCPQVGRCCAVAGGCSIALQNVCTGGGVWTLGGNCSPNPCPQAGACCATNGACTLVVQASCVGTWTSGGNCSPNICPQPGTCCAVNGTCTFVLQGVCVGTGPWTVGGVCSPNPCPQPGACCLPDGSCLSVVRSSCAGVWTLAGVCGASACAQPHVAVVRTVRAAGTGTIAPWTMATTSLATALGASAPGDEVWIASGTYLPGNSSGFAVPAGVHVYGGFAGTETAREQRLSDPSMNITVLSGPANHVVTAGGAGAEATLDRLTIRAGGGNYVGTTADSRGGGLYAEGGAVTISNCRFEQNRSGTIPVIAFLGMSPGGAGAGACVAGGCVATFTGCVFDSNACSVGYSNICEAGNGADGAPGGDGGATAVFASTARFVDCAFTNNAASAGLNGTSCSFRNGIGGPGGRGGAIYSEGSIAECTRCTFSGNVAGAGGGGGNFGGSGVANGAGGGGGAVAVVGGTGTLTSCVFRGNAAGRGGSQAAAGWGTVGANGGAGGAVWASGAGVSIVNSVLWGNTSGAGGAGMFNGNSGCSNGGGAAGPGGAIGATGGTVSLIACTIAANNPGAPGAGSASQASPTTCAASPPACCLPGPTGAAGVGGIAGDSGTAIISDCIVWGNGSGQIVLPAATVSFSCVQGGFAGAGNIGTDPAFANLAAGDVRLTSGSPCIDTGSNTPVPATVASDVGGLLRFVAGCGVLLDSGAQATIDMGAYEYQGGGADCNADGVCDLREVSGVQVLRAPAPAATDRFGWAADVRGDVAIIGARSTNTSAGIGAGAAYVYARQGSVWGNRQTLLQADGAAMDDFGNWVAMGDSWAVVSARFADVGGLVDAGAVYVFRNGASGWAQTAKLTAFDAHAGDEFGHGAAIDQDRIVVGALYGDAPGTADCGAAYVYKFNGAGWALEQKLTPADPTPGKGFGICVAMRDDTIVVGAPYDGNAGVAGGAAYVFQRFGTSWVQIAKVLPFDSDDHVGINFGELVAISGDRFIANAPRLTHTGRTQAGAAYIFHKSGSSWVQERRLISNAPQDGEWFGFDVAIDGDTAMLGGFRRTIAGQPYAGAAYVYRRFGTTWMMASRIDAPEPTAFGFFGYGIGLSAGRAIVSGFQLPAGSVAGAGAARTFDLSLLDGNGDGIPDSCQIGAGVLADVDGNGIPDVVQFNPCRADFNNIGGISAQDIFDFLSAWFSGSPSADFNGVNGLNAQDIFDFLSAWFTGC